ncbi:MAG: hypothetical protein ACJ790_00730 [Myxococcaceae bacterium]
MSSADRDLRARLEALQAERRHLEETLAAAPGVEETERVRLQLEKTQLEAAVQKLRFERSEIYSELRQTDRETNEALKLAKAWRRQKSRRPPLPGAEPLPFAEQLGDVLVAAGLVGVYAATFLGIGYGVLVRLHGQAASVVFGALVLLMPVGAIGVGLSTWMKRRKARR